MGLISHVWKAEYWKLEDKKATGTKYNNPVVYVNLGDWDDYDGCGDLCEWMDKQLYNDIKEGKYQVIRQPYAEKIIKVLDKDNNEIDLITGKIKIQ